MGALPHIYTTCRQFQAAVVDPLYPLELQASQLTTPPKPSTSSLAMTSIALACIHTSRHLFKVQSYPSGKEQLVVADTSNSS